MSNIITTSFIANSTQILVILIELCLIFFTTRIKKTFILFYFKTSLIILTFGVLIYAFIVSDFSVQNVFLNSSNFKPLIYKVAGAWASHEGSILLFLVLLSIIGAFCLNNAPNFVKTTQIRIICFVELLFSLFIYFTSNPFTEISFSPKEGLGLNPVLQDVGLAFHPPILYLGVACYLAPFTSAIVILLFKNNISSLNINSIINNIKLFSSIGLFCLTIGVGLGSWWAYRELGWGGFWFFDPVENISLLPWILGIALHHSILITLSSNKALNLTLMLSVGTFLICVLGTFLVRSGLLISVHSFSNSGIRSIFLFCILLILAVPSIILLFCNRFSDAALNTKSINKIQFMRFGIVFLVLIATVFLFTIIYPVIYSFCYGQVIAIKEEFFWYKVLPIFIPILILAGVCTLKGNYRYILLITTLLTLISSYLVNHSILSCIFTLTSLYLITQTIMVLIIKSNYFQQSISAKAASMVASHLGFGMLVLFITFNSLLKTQMEFIGKKNDTIKFNQLTVSLKNISFASGPNYYRQIAEFWIKHDNNVTILKPENRFYPIENAISVESNIFSYLFYDIYAVLSKVEDDMIYAQIYYRPFINFIWLSIILIGLGFLISSCQYMFKIDYFRKVNR